MEKRCRVLFVDDEEYILNSLRRLFREAPWTTLFAGSAAEALELIEAGGAFDVVVTDQRMPGMTGVELLHKLRSTCPGTIRMVLSSYSDVDTILSAINEGFAYKFLTKPWKNDVLYQTVAEIVEAVELRRENRRLVAKMETQAAEISAVDWLVQELDAYQIEPPSIDVARSILDSLPLAVLALREDGRIALANAEACKLLKAQAPGELLGQPLTEQELHEKGVSWKRIEVSRPEGWRGVLYTSCAG